MSFNILLSYLQILPYNTFVRGEIIRHCFNFRHTNSLGLFSLALYTLICYVNPRTSGLLILK